MRNTYLFWYIEKINKINLYQCWKKLIEKKTTRTIIIMRFYKNVTLLIKQTRRRVII